MKKSKTLYAVTACLICLSVFSSCAEGKAPQSSDTISSETITEVHTEMPEKIFEEAVVNTSYKVVAVDGSTANTNPAAAYRGLGVVTGNNSSRLLIDYKSEQPERYWEIMNYLFKKDSGAGLTHIKIEFGTDVNSSSGTEPATMRSSDEAANVRRGAGFIFAADALSINPDITVDLLRWGEPKWVTDAFSDSDESGFAARYKWYLDTINAAYDELGIQFSYISADANEAERIDTEWLIYFSEHLKSETDCRYDYSQIKIVASDEVGTWKIADEMMSNERLRNAVDVLGEHYNTWASENAKILNRDYGKEIWYSEGVASTNIARLSVNSNGSGINGTNGCLDVCNRIINGYYNGMMTMYEYQPAVAAYYSGAKYFPKSIINANEPWSGYYEIDAGVWTSAHFTMFMEAGWQYIDSGCFGDGKENHAISETTNNYMTAANPETGDYSIVVCNDSDKQRNYTFTVSNLAKADAPIYIWETVGPGAGEAYNANYLKNIAAYKPADNGDGTFSYSVNVKPYSIITITTLEKTDVPVPSEIECPIKSEVLSLPYEDSFDYGADFIDERGGTPKYTTDQGGAFEVCEYNGGYALMQMITAENKPTNWRFRGTPNPITSLGDDRWSNYSADVDVLLSSGNEDNYAGIGILYTSSEIDSNSAESGYSLRIYGNGMWSLRMVKSEISGGTIENFDYTAVHNLKISHDGNVITAYLDGGELFSYEDEQGLFNSGRISLASGYYNNIFDNLKAKPIEGRPYCITRIDDHDAAVTYEGEWDRVVPKGYTEFNRTSSAAECTVDGEHASFTFNFTGTEFALIGPSDYADIEVTIDGETESARALDAGSRQVFYKRTAIPEGEHTVTVAVTDGKIVLDVIETA